jgi:hypothetical protein
MPPKEQKKTVVASSALLFLGDEPAKQSVTKKCAGDRKRPRIAVHRRFDPDQ